VRNAIGYTDEYGDFDRHTVSDSYGNSHSFVYSCDVVADGSPDVTRPLRCGINSKRYSGVLCGRLQLLVRYYSERIPEL